VDGSIVAIVPNKNSVWSGQAGATAGVWFNKGIGWDGKNMSVVSLVREIGCCLHDPNKTPNYTGHHLCAEAAAIWALDRNVFWAQAKKWHRIASDQEEEEEEHPGEEFAATAAAVHKSEQADGIRPDTLDWEEDAEKREHQLDAEEEKMEIEAALAEVQETLKAQRAAHEIVNGVEQHVKEDMAKHERHLKQSVVVVVEYKNEGDDSETTKYKRFFFFFLLILRNTTQSFSVMLYFLT